MLRNVAYVGKTYSISRDRREGDLIQASWPAIVDEELFASVQRILDRYNHAGRAGRRPKEYLFAGLLICRGCWRRMHARTTAGGARYRCRRDLADGQRCVEGGHAIAESALLPWAEVLMERLSALQPQGFRAALEGPGAVRFAPRARSSSLTVASSGSASCSCGARSTKTSTGASTSG